MKKFLAEKNASLKNEFLEKALNSGGKFRTVQLHGGKRFIKPVAWVVVGAASIYAGIQWQF